MRCCTRCPGARSSSAWRVKLAVFLVGLALGGVPPFFAVVDTVAGLAAACGLAYFVFRLIVLAKRRLLWRVRRKLILSYIFIGFVPALLHRRVLPAVRVPAVLQLQLVSGAEPAARAERAGALPARRARRSRFSAPAAATSPASSALRQANAAREYPDVSIAVVPVNRSVRQPVRNSELPNAGIQTSDQRRARGRTSSRRAAMPAWIDCRRLHRRAGVLAPPRPSTAPAEDTHLMVRARRVSRRAATGLRGDRRSAGERRDPSAAAQGHRRRAEERDGGAADERTTTREPIAGRPAATRAAAAARRRPGLLSSLTSFIDYHDWATGASGPLTVTSALSIPELYDRISAAEGSVGRTLGQGLLLVLFAIGGLFLIIEAMALIAGFALAKSITGSVHELFTGTERVRQGDFTHKIAVHSRGSARRAGAVVQLDDRQHRGSAARRRRRRSGSRRSCASRTRSRCRCCRRGRCVMAGLSVTALCVPAREVGGDYYDFLPLDDHRVGVLIADVSGKGTSAALYMAELKGLMLSLSRDPHARRATLLIAANRIIADHLDARSFITMTYAVVDLDARDDDLRARRPHAADLRARRRRRRRTAQVQVLAPDGMVLGLKLDNGEMFERLLVEETIPLHAGDLYLLFTDGISEAMNADDDLFGEARLGRLVEEHARPAVRGAARARAARDRRVRRRRAAARRHDDDPAEGRRAAGAAVDGRRRPRSSPELAESTVSDS